jgi:hypothetical protein
MKTKHSREACETKWVDMVGRPGDTIGSPNSFEVATQARRMSMTLSVEPISEWKTWVGEEVMVGGNALFEDVVLCVDIH